MNRLVIKLGLETNSLKRPLWEQEKETKLTTSVNHGYCHRERVCKKNVKKQRHNI
ncbi:unnamed protein product [Sphenostylis stenocarpa]|uniref:Uncharacterized protein n=1 Tax=Sphenostylis stenocarpa TaxID=92480 RepID=A0AA86SY74_9FABA|nr:unnamed protein product [Sphenostylis stenocarpa]